MRVSSNAINSVDLRFVMEAKKGPRIVIAKRYNERSLCRVKQEVKPRKTNNKHYYWYIKKLKTFSICEITDRLKFKLRYKRQILEEITKNIGNVFTSVALF